MKYLFAIVAVVLAGASIATYMNYPQVGNPIPIIYWVTDPNPQRIPQAMLFHDWQIKQGHCNTVVLKTLKDVRRFKQKNWSMVLKQAMVSGTPGVEKIFPKAVHALAQEPDQTTNPRHLKATTPIPPLTKADLPLAVKVPVVELRLDTGNDDNSKKLIQGVAGVADDIMDNGSGGNIRYFHAVGLNVDITKPAKKLGFDLSHTWPVIKPELTIPADNGQRHQYAFPCNVGSQMLFVNKDTFKKFHQPIPPYEWTSKKFERLGKAYVKAANAGLAHQEYFYANNINPITVARSLGGSTFNETMTRCTFDTPPWTESLSLLKKWTNKDHILPTAADRNSFNSQAGYGGESDSLFQAGNYAMIATGRYAMIRFRQSETSGHLMHLTVVNMPNGGFPNCNIGTRCASIYTGSKHKKLAELFLAYLASKTYNMSIVRGADSLPPDPKYTKVPEFIHPADHPNEVEINRICANVMNTIGIGNTYSPFVLHTIVLGKLGDAQGAVMNNRLSPEAACRRAARDVNTEIQRDIKSNPKHLALYNRLLKDQHTIDRLRKEHKKVPLKLIRNPFYKKYYQSKGWAE